MSKSTATIQLSIDMVVRIRSDCELLQSTESSVLQTGQCWHSLFQNPVIVQGFPIRARNHGEMGLEIPVDIMAGLGNADYHAFFKKIPVIKAFSSMFIATQQLDCSMLWHFVVNLSGQRLPYSTALDYHPDNSTIKNFGFPDVTRNFVGWTSSVRRLAGKFQRSFKTTLESWVLVINAKYNH